MLNKVFWINTIAMVIEASVTIKSSSSANPLDQNESEQ